MTNFLQVLLTGLGLGSAYALFAQGVVLIYRGSGIVNFAQGALGMLASYVTFYELRTTNSWPIGLAIVGGIAAAVLVALLFQAVVLRLLTNAAPIVRLISTLGLLDRRPGRGRAAVRRVEHPGAALPPARRLPVG